MTTTTEPPGIHGRDRHAADRHRDRAIRPPCRARADGDPIVRRLACGCTATRPTPAAHTAATSGRAPRRILRLAPSIASAAAAVAFVAGAPGAVRVAALAALVLAALWAKRDATPTHFGHRDRPAIA